MKQGQEKRKLFIMTILYLKELIQKKCSKRNIITELYQLLKNENVLRVRKEYKILRNRLGKKKTSLKVAELITKV